MRLLVICTTILFLLLSLGLAACQSDLPQPALSPLNISETTLVPTSNSTATTLQLPPSSPGTPAPVENAIITPKPDQQVYTDPQGGYAVNFSAALLPTDKENYFTDGATYFETGYLPELGTLSSGSNVCAWLANVVEEEPYNFSVHWMPSGRGEVCSISSKADVPRQVHYEIFENPGAEPAHRFAYIKTGWYATTIVPGWTFHTDFSWLKPIEPSQNKPGLSPINSEIIEAWGKTLPILQNVTVSEYPLPPGSDPYQQMLLDSLPEEARPDWAGDRCFDSQPQTSPDEKLTLETLGYDLKTEMMAVPSGEYPRTQLYRDGRLWFDYVYQVSDIYQFTIAEGPLVAFVVTTRSMDGQTKAFLIQNDAVINWQTSHQDPPFKPILVQDQLLWLKVSEDWNQVQVIRSNPESNEVLYSFSVHTEPLYSTQKFVSWQEHWTWAARDFLIQDGEILNEKLGFQEIFEWRLLNDNPAFLFRKDGRMGFSYDNQIIPLEYQNVARNLCCGYAVNNPAICNNSAHFFAERDGVWYYVVLKFNP